MEIKIVIVAGQEEFIVPLDNNYKSNITFIKVGDKDYPATETDILNVAKNLKKCLQEPNGIMVTHHAITTEVVPIYNRDEASRHFLMQLYDRNVITATDLKKELNLFESNQNE